MNDETKLPEDLQHAVDLIMESDVLHEVAQESAEAIRAEHTQRMTLQHHAADMAQRVADLEAERDNTASHIASIGSQLGDAALQVDDIAVRVLALAAERDAAQQARRDAQELAERYQDERNKAGVQARREVAEQVRDLTVERDRLQHAYHQQRDDAQARVCAAIMRALAAEKERDELRARLAAVTNKAGEFVNDVRGLVDESEGIAGLHLNGDVADWGSLLPGGRFERLTALDDLEELINEAPEYKA